MARHGYSLSGQVSPASRLSPECSIILPQHSESVASLANVETIRATLGLSRKESHWRLTHAAPSFELAPEQFLSPSSRGFRRYPEDSRHHATASLVTSLDISQRPLRPPSRNLSPQLPQQRQKSMPTDRDYRRMLNKLDKIINGSALSFRLMSLSESKPVELTMDAEEWQYLKVKTEGLQIPMKATLQRARGRVVVYLSTTSQEPSDMVNDEVHTKDVFLFSEAGLRFKTQWVFLGVKCLEEAIVTVTVKFGLKHKKNKSTSRLPALTDLNELRKDDAKRQALNKHVDSLLSLRQAAWASKYSERDFIRENKALGKAEDMALAKRDLEQQRREEALKRHVEVMHEKKERAKLLLRRQELRLEAEARARVVREEKEKVQAQQRAWLSLLPFLPSVERVFEVFRKRKADIEEAARQVKAAMVLQRCYRKVLLTVNPKRLVRQHALNHLTLLMCMVAPEVAWESRIEIYMLIRDSAKAHRVTDALSNYYKKSKCHVVNLIQMMWRRYRGIKQDRLERLGHIWNEAIRLLLPEQTSNKKALKKAKELETKYKRLDRDSVLKAHLRACQAQYYKDIESYIKANKIFRKGIKAFIFAKLKKGEAVYLSGAPDFHYLIPVQDVQKMILDAANVETS